MLEKLQINSGNLLFYNGPISIEMISFMANHVRDLLDEDDIASKKLFKVFIELAQNVSYYSAKVVKGGNKTGSSKGIGYVSVDLIESGYCVTTGNLIHVSHGPILEKNCDEINKLDEVELRELKRKTRIQAAVRDVGAHIGLIHTGLISGSKLKTLIEPIDDKHSFFTISISIPNEV